MTTTTIGNGPTKRRVQQGVERLIETAHDQGFTTETVLSWFDELTNMMMHRQAHGGSLSDDQVQYLMRTGAFTEASLEAAESRVADGDLEHAQRRAHFDAIVDSLSTAEVADKLGIDDSRVRHRNAKGNLYSFLAGNRRRYPKWQFTNSDAVPVVPGLATVTAAIPEDMHPTTVSGFMTTPQEDLLLGHEPVSPIEWLVRGGEATSVATILEGYLYT